MHKNIVQYFNYCYQADNRSLTLWDMNSDECESLRITNALHNSLTQIDTEYALEVENKITTYRREKAFVYGHHLVCGKVKIYGDDGYKIKKVFSPLLVYDAYLQKKEYESSVLDLTTPGHFLTIDEQSIRLNEELIAGITNNRDAISELNSRLSDKNLLNSDWIRVWLLENTNNSQKAGLTINKIKNVDYEIGRNITPKGNQLDLYATGAFALTKRSLSSRGIIDELNQIAESETLSAPLSKVLFCPDTDKLTSRKSQLKNIPGILSAAQSKAIENAAQQSLSLLIGPPGTGKSYTVAAMVLERFMQGESILVVSENEYAMDVIQQKLVDQLGISSTAILRAGNSDYHKQLKTYLSDLTKGIRLEKPGNSHQAKLDSIEVKIADLEHKFLMLTKQSVTDGTFLDVIQQQTRIGAIQRIRAWFIKRRLKKHGLLFSVFDKIKSLQYEREDMLSKHINHTYITALNIALKNHRHEFVTFSKAIRARTSSQQDHLFSKIDYRLLLKALPVWLCPLTALHKALPLRESLFDLVIIDEATQASISSCLPALYRAKRAVIVGDPKQLRHLSFLSRKQQKSIQSKTGLNHVEFDINYRDNSLIDFADQAVKRQSEVTFLDEHYRSLPDIIEFSNSRFYGNSLRVMTEKPGTQTRSPLRIVNVQNATRVDGINRVEARAIIDKTKEIIESQRHIPDKFKLSIGLLSFFSDQSKLLQDLLYAECAIVDLSRHKIRAGTPYAFQGEERDIMLISCAVDDNTPNGTYQYLNRPDVFNVAITRARNLQFIFVSSKSIPHTSLLSQYLNSITSIKPRTAKYDNVSRDRNIRQLITVFEELNYTILQNHPIAGITMDLILLNGSSVIAVDLIGFPGEYEDALHIEHYKIFERAGLDIFPITFAAWQFDRDGVLDGLQEAFLAQRKNSNIEVSIRYLSTHLEDLLAIKPGLAHPIRRLERDLIEQEFRPGLEQLASLIDHYHTFLWVLSQKLNPRELTFYRYVDSSEQAFLNVIENLRNIIVMLKSRTPLHSHQYGAEAANGDSKLHQSQKNKIDQILQTNTLAITLLEDLSIKWSQTNTANLSSEKDFLRNLQDLTRLSDRVQLYSTDYSDHN